MHTPSGKSELKKPILYNGIIKSTFFLRNFLIHFSNFGGNKMRKRNIFDAMKSMVASTLNDAPMELLAISQDSSTDEETGEVKEFIRVEAEVPRGYDSLSRCRFTVKIPNAPLRIEENKLEDADYHIKFQGLIISYIDENRNVYFRADNYEVKPM